MTTEVQQRARHRYCMRKVIKGHAYDTETASCIAFWDCTEYGPNQGEDLYLTVHGHYFVVRHDEEAVSSGWQPEDDRWDQFLNLKPLTRIEAITWTEKNCWRLVEELFGRMPEPGEGEAYTPLP